MTETKKIRVVIPGEYVGTSEEFLPGNHTYEIDGKIYSMVMGLFEVDTNEMVVYVRPLNPPLLLNIKKIVIGMISDVKGTMAIVDIIRVLGEKRCISGESIGTIHLSKVSEWYIQNIQQEFRVGDIVKAKVIQVKPSLQLATNSPEFGVVLGFCYRCRNQLVKQHNLLYCKNCERVETRKISADYGNINV